MGAHSDGCGSLAGSEAAQEKVQRLAIKRRETA